MEKKVSRKKFLTWSFGISSLLAVPAFLKISSEKKHKATTVKMLTQDGNLVEIDVAHIPAKRKRIKTEDIHRWIKKASL